ncbi:MAG: IPExxxVDY family protein [Weeksellaceae bacterium]|jgi:hypothetical protein|nr:IPExxxVDY family protein [Weeksellaceae bacterium]
MKPTLLFLDEEDLIDFQVYGLISNYTDGPKFIYQINQFFHTQFKRVDDLEILMDGMNLRFPLFEWIDKQTQIKFHIIKNIAYTIKENKNSNNLSHLFDISPPLLKSYKEYTYFLRIQDDESNSLPVKETHFIQKITKLDTKKIKSIDYLIF